MIALRIKSDRRNEQKRTLYSSRSIRGGTLRVQSKFGYQRQVALMSKTGCLHREIITSVIISNIYMITNNTGNKNKRLLLTFTNKPKYGGPNLPPITGQGWKSLYL